MGLTQITTGGVDDNINIDSNTLKVDGTNNRVGIGTASPSTSLDVSGAISLGSVAIPSAGTARIYSRNTDNNLYLQTGSGDTINFLDGSQNTLASFSDTTLVFNTGNTERMRINNSGRLLVNTTTVLETSNAAKLQITHTSGASIALGRDDSAVSAGNDLGKIAFYGNDGGGYEKVAQILCEADGTHASGDKPGRLLFQTTADGASSPTERMRIDSSGQVGIGTTSPSSLLHLESASSPKLLLVDTTNSCTLKAYAQNSNAHLGTESSHDFIFDTNNTERLRIDSSGRLLSGLTSSSASASAVFQGFAGSSAGQAILQLQVGKNNAATANNENLGSVRFGNSDGALGALISSEADGQWASSDYPGRLTFHTTADGASSPTERMRIDSSGLLGVGVSSPVAQVQINSNKNAETNKHQAGNYHLLLKNDQDDTGEAIGLAFSITSNATAVGASILHERDGGGSQGSLQFLTNGGSDTITERMRIDNAGNILLACTTNSASSDTGVKIGQGNNPWLRIVGNESGGSNFFFSGYNTNSTNNGYRIKVRFDGGIENHSANNVNLSDEREKKNIVNLDTKWDKVKSWELKKFHYNDDADTDDLRYGVIAQQVEEHCPEVLSSWVKQSAEDAVLDGDGNVVTPAVPEVVRKGVKEQQMMWMAIKALQEAQARIETLETKVAALEAAE